jgi:glucose-1-phosphate thymidylyltransferase
MKGVVLAGGYGTRLSPLTKVFNKHLLPVWREPMIYHPIKTLVEAGVREIMIVTGGNSAGDFLELLSNGKSAFGDDVELSYTYQDGAGGIPAALRYARDFSDGDAVCVILGDNIFEPGVATGFIRGFQGGGRIFLKEVHDPNRYGVAVLEGSKIRGMIEKPQDYISPYAITGLYCFDGAVWDVIDTLTESARGELEVVDIHRHYHRSGNLSYEICEGWWTDAGTHESLYQASTLMRDHERNHAV